MAAIFDGGPAFPDGDYEGLTMLDYFAAEVMPEVLREYWETVRLKEIEHQPDWREGCSVDAYRIASAMLSAREAKP